MVDDTNYITPHEAALAVVATSMKKARLHITTLIINSIMGGVLFCSGSMLFVMIHSNSPGIQANNPGMLDILGGISYGIGLFFVVIMGVDLYNSNILFFSVGVLRRAVTIWDLLISWFVSLFGNLAGALFMSYVLLHLSSSSTTEMVVKTSIELGEAKAHPSFIQVFLKGIGGNIYVCLAIYLQLLAKPIHVKLLMLILPIFTFVTIGFSHTIADMGVMFIAMLNGAQVTVGEYIWKVLIPTAIGNAVGGFAFALILPFYLHLEVVEHDRKKLALPKYEARDEQPELNMDSRVVRITSKEHEEYADVNDAEEDESITPVTSTTDTGYTNSKRNNTLNQRTTQAHPINTQYHSDSMSNLSASLYSNNADMEFDKPQAFIPNVKSHESDKLLRRYTTISKDGKRHIRSPPGLFPVRGMGTPLTKERTIEDSTNIDDELNSVDTTDHVSQGGLLSRIQTNQTNKSNMIKKIKTLEREEQDEYEQNGGYNVEESKPSAQLGRALSRIISTKHTNNSSNKNHDLESGFTQEPFPFNQPDEATSYDNSSVSESLGTVLKETFSHRRKSFREAGITDRIAMMANNTAGEDNYSPSDNIARHDKSRPISRVPSSTSRTSHSGLSHEASRVEPNLENTRNKLESNSPTEADNIEDTLKSFGDHHNGPADATTSNEGASTQEH